VGEWDEGGTVTVTSDVGRWFRRCLVRLREARNAGGQVVTGAGKQMWSLKGQDTRKGRGTRTDPSWAVELCEDTQERPGARLI
jgi:hypothetical protein